MADRAKIRAGIQKAPGRIKTGAVPRKEWRQLVDTCLAREAGADLSIGDIRAELVNMEHEAEMLALLERIAKKYGYPLHPEEPMREVIERALADGDPNALALSGTTPALENRWSLPHGRAG